jgi:hypothetical protein
VSPPAASPVRVAEPLVECDTTAFDDCSSASRKPAAITVHAALFVGLGGGVLLLVLGGIALILWATRIDSKPTSDQQAHSQAPHAKILDPDTSEQLPAAAPTSPKSPTDNKPAEEQRETEKLTQREREKEERRAKETQRQQERERLLAALEAEHWAGLSDMGREGRQLFTEKQMLDQERRKWQNVDIADLVFNPRALTEYNAYRRKAIDNYKKIQALEEKVTQTNNEYTQATRRILVNYPQPGDPALLKYKGMLLTKEEKAEHDAFLQLHRTPRTVADQLIRELQNNRTIPNASYLGVFTNQNDKNSVAVCYALTGVLGRKYVNKQPVFILVYKRTTDGLWYAPDVSGSGANVLLGPPPSGYH